MEDEEDARVDEPSGKRQEKPLRMLAHLFCYVMEKGHLLSQLRFFKLVFP
jgi:hypothetical protein